MFLRRWIASFLWLVLTPLMPLVAQGNAPTDTGMHRIGDTWTFTYQNADLTQVLRALVDAVGVTARLNNMPAGKTITLQEHGIQTSTLYGCIRALAILNGITITGDSLGSPYWSIDGQNGRGAGPGFTGDYPRDPCQLAQALGGGGDRVVDARASTSMWSNIQYPSVTIPGTAGEQLTFSVEPEGHPRWPGDDSPHLRLDLSWQYRRGVPMPKALASLQDIVVRLHTADGKILTGQQQLGGSGGTNFTGVLTAALVNTFPWSRNALDEAWFEVRVPGRTWWLELPYGFTRNPEDPEVPDGSREAPHFPPGMHPGANDSLVPWRAVEYDIGRLQDSSWLSLKLGNPVDATPVNAAASVTLRRGPTLEVGPDRSRQNLDTPHVAVRIEAAGDTLTGSALDRRFGDEDHHIRIDDFTFNTRLSGSRAFVAFIVTIDGRRYEVRVPSSLAPQ